MIDVSVVIPVYNEEKNVAILSKELVSVLSKMGVRYEIIFADDGSTDRTFDEVSAIRKRNRKVKLIGFQRNYGKSAALTKLFQYASGDIVITMDGDLQDDPREIPRFVSKVNDGYDLVVGWKYVRHDPFLKRFPSKIFNYLTRVFTGVSVHDSNCGFKAYRKSVVKNIRIYGELHRYIPSLVKRMGFSVAEIKVNHRPRKYGVSKYGLSRLVKGSLDMVTVLYLNNFTRQPFYFFGIIGFVLSGFGFLAGLYLVYLWCLDVFIGDRPLLILSVLMFLSGVQFISIGLLGEIFVGGSGERGEYVIVRDVQGLRR